VTGMWLSHVSLNISMHDTLYVVAHFHLMLSGAVMMGVFVGFYFYFHVFFFVKYPRTFSYFHIIYYSAGQWLAFLPLFWVSFSGLPRRLHDFPAVFMGWQSMSTVGHFITMLGVLFFYTTLFESHLEKKLISYLFSLVPRLNKRMSYYLLKIINFQIQAKGLSITPDKKTRSAIICNL
jgi:cytochrome c oxidase subunit 1